jgi:hypothetical protein
VRWRERTGFEGRERGRREREKREREETLRAIIMLVWILSTNSAFAVPSQQLRCLNQFLSGVVAFTRHLSSTKEDKEEEEEEEGEPDAQIGSEYGQNMTKNSIRIGANLIESLSKILNDLPIGVLDFDVKKHSANGRTKKTKGCFASRFQVLLGV